jgi:hypothetical protein
MRFAPDMLTAAKTTLEGYHPLINCEILECLPKIFVSVVEVSLQEIEVKMYGLRDPPKLLARE